MFFLVLAVLGIVSFAVVKLNKTPVYKKGSSATFDVAIAAATNVYRKMAVEKIDMSSGPCLTNDLMPGWVVDVVHTPREVSDDLPENQCQAYREGRATHFVELDQSGNLVRVR